MKPTEQQLSDPQWWEIFQPKGCELLLVCNDLECDDLWAHFNGHRYEVGTSSYSSNYVTHNYQIHRRPEHKGSNEKHGTASKFIPEAGQWCEMHCSTYWAEIDVKAVTEQHVIFCEVNKDNEQVVTFDRQFRPIKSVRDVQAEKFAKVLQKDDQEVTELCNRDVSHFMSGGYALYDNGARFNDE